jgi:ParB family chromosome partitioning protein
MDIKSPGKMKKRGLGRGLSALFDDDEDDAVPAADASTDAASGGAGVSRRVVGIDQLEPGTFQPRKTMDADSLKELSESIAVHGVLQPILVREKPGAPGRYEIIAGERRWRASQKAQLHEVPVIVKDFDDSTAMQVALIENLQREDLNAIEEALGYRRLMEEFSHTQEKLAAALGKSRSHIANMVRLLNLPDSVQAEIRQGKISAGHARALITAENPEALMRQIIAQGLSVRDTEKLAAQKAGKAKPAGRTFNGSEKDIDTLALEEEMSNALGMKVTIDMKSGGKGAFKIDFKSLDQLDEVLRLLSQSKAGRMVV